MIAYNVKRRAYSDGDKPPRKDATSATVQSLGEAKAILNAWFNVEPRRDTIEYSTGDTRYDAGHYRVFIEQIITED